MSQQRKKQKLEHGEITQDPVVYFDSRRIPFDIWDEIFQYTTRKDLLSLSLVCKNFNETIGNLPEVMDKITLDFGKIDFEENLMPQLARNYTNIKITCFYTLREFYTIYEKFGPNLRALEVNNLTLTKKQLMIILKSTSNNLKVLTVKRLSINKNSQNTVTQNSFKLMKLEKLVLDSGDIVEVLLDILPETILDVEMKVHFKKIDDNFLEFLEKQKNLKRLNLYSYQNEDFFSTFDGTKINFKLEDLKVNLAKLSNYENFYKFLKSQADTLTSLKLKNISFYPTYGAFECMPKLKEIDIGCESCDRYLDYESGIDFCSPSLKIMRIGFYRKSDYLRFIRRFQNAQELVFDMKTNSQVLKMIAEKHPNLKKLIFRYFWDYDFDLTSLSSILELVVIGSYYGVNREKQVSDIIMDDSIIAMKNLKVLKLRKRVLLSSKSLFWILLNFKKLKHLEVDNGAALSETFLYKNSKFFENLKFLKIRNLNAPLTKFEKKLKRFPKLKYSLSCEKTRNLFYEDYGFYDDGEEDNDDNDTNHYNDYSDSDSLDESDFSEDADDC